MNIFKKLIKNINGSGLVEKIMVTAFAVAAGGAVIAYTSNVIINAQNQNVSGVLDGSGGGQTVEINGNQVHTDGFYLCTESDWANVVSIVGNKLYIYNPDNEYINRFDNWQSNTDRFPYWLRPLVENGTTPEDYRYATSWIDHSHDGTKVYHNLEEYCNRAVSEFGESWLNYEGYSYLELHDIADAMALE